MEFVLVTVFIELLQHVITKIHKIALIYTLHRSLQAHIKSQPVTVFTGHHEIVALNYGYSSASKLMSLLNR
jgi:hypothetical protein